MKVLYVDDEENALELAKEYFKKLDSSIQVITTNSGGKAYDYVTKEHVDAIISDFQMPEMNGLELLRKIRDNNIKTPFIIFTGRGREEVAIAALNLGANGYIQKGGDLVSLFALLVQLIKNEVSKYDAEQQIYSFKQIVDTINDGIWLADASSITKYVNPKMASLLGYEQKEMIDRPVAQFIDPEDLQQVIASFAKVLDRSLDDYRACFVTKSGKKVRCHIYNRLITDSTAKVIGGVAIVNDLDTLQIVQENQAFFNEIMLHDMKNKNIALHGYLTLALKSTQSSEQVEYVKRALGIVSGCNQLLEKSNSINKLSQIHTQRPMKVSEIIKDILEEIKNHLFDHKITVQYENHDYWVIGGELITELFINLIDNAVQHAHCSMLHISSIPEGNMLITTIEDDGCGISSEIVKNLFTRGGKGKSSSGTGIGLFLALKIAESYKGTIKYQSSTYGGARFDVWLPLASHPLK